MMTTMRGTGRGEWFVCNTEFFIIVFVVDVHHSWWWLQWWLRWEGLGDKCGLSVIQSSYCRVCCRWWSLVMVAADINFWRYWHPTHPTSFGSVVLLLQNWNWKIIIIFEWYRMVLWWRTESITVSLPARKQKFWGLCKQLSSGERGRRSLKDVLIKAPVNMHIIIITTTTTTIIIMIIIIRWWHSW